MYAAEQGDLEIGKLLLSHTDIKIDAQDSFGNTALMRAVPQDCAEMVKLPLEYGADLFIISTLKTQQSTGQLRTPP